MLIAMDTLNIAKSKLDGMAKKIKDDTKIETVTEMRGRVYGVLYDISLSLGELLFRTKNYNVSEFYNNNLNRVQALIDMEVIDKNEFKKIICSAIEDINEVEDLSLRSTDEYSTFVSFNKYGRKYVPAELLNFINVLNTGVEVNKREVSVFIPECKEGDLIYSFNCMQEKCTLKSYGIESDEYELSKAKQKMTKVVKGTIKGARIQNKAFDIVYVNPTISDTLSDNELFMQKRPEKNNVLEIVKYAREGGLVFITLPVTRLYQDMCAMLARQLKDIKVFKTNDYDFKHVGLITIVGKKEVSKTYKDDEYTKLRSLYDYNNIEEIDLTEKYVLPNVPIFIDIFKGSALDMEELNDIVSSSSLIDNMFEDQKIDKLEDNIKNPLLPFNIGQLGLVLTSGCLDGIVDEGDGNKHLIKGRVAKKILMEEVTTPDGIEVTETAVNKVEIGVMLPNGDYKVLA